MPEGDFERLLEESVKIHGHLCPGQVLGVKMALWGLEKIGIGDPKGVDRKNFLVFVEIDRCATDALQSVTGCSLGKRSLKFLDYGKMAATFLNLKTGKAFRVLAREDIRDEAPRRFPQISDKYQAQLQLYRLLPPEELFMLEEVSVAIRDQDLPGRPLGRVVCQVCGETIQDGKERSKEGQILCRPCDNGGYYRPT